jgi:hypothetical protein
MQCDGAQPVCGRCKGMAYKCVYSNLGKRIRKFDPTVMTSGSGIEVSRDDLAGLTELSTLRVAVQEYERLVKDIIPKIPEAEQAEALEAVGSINSRVQQAQLGRFSQESETVKSPETPRSLPYASVRSSQRYLGEVSDVHFFNVVDRLLRGQDGEPKTEPEDEAMSSYEQDEPPSAGPDGNRGIDLPSRQVADEYLNIYFSTIHVAYPFIPRSKFLRTYDRYMNSQEAENWDGYWLGTLCMPFKTWRSRNNFS